MAVIEINGLADLESFHGGAVAIEFRRALVRILADCRDRPAVGHPRKIGVTLVLRPEADASGALAALASEVELTVSAPLVRTGTIRLAAKAGDVLVYDDLSPNDPRQQTLPLTAAADEECETTVDGDEADGP